MAADCSSGNHSPKAAINSGDNQLHRKNLPWVLVVRGEQEAAAPPSPSSSSSPPVVSPPPSNTIPGASELENSDSGNGNVGSSNKSPWKKPVNGDVEAAAVMGDNWPSISESTRASAKSSSDSLKPLSDISIAIPQGPVPSTQKQANTNAKHNSTQNHTHTVRQRPIKRGGGTGAGSGQSGFSRPPPPPPFPVFEIPFGNLAPSMLESYVGEPPYNARSVGVVGSHSHMGNDHSSHRHSSRRGNFGSRPRGDGVYGRRDQPPRNSTPRDVHIRPMVPPPPPPLRGFARPPPSVPFIPPHHLRPFGNPMGFDAARPMLYVPTLPPEPFRGMPLAHAPPPPAMFYPVVDPLHALLVNQIDYYFSDANLVKDDFLRSNMDVQGWVSINLIASFPRVLNLTSNVQLILECLRASTVVEIQGDKVRRRNDWKKWIPSFGKFPPDSGLQSPSESTDKMLASSFKEVSLDEMTTKENNTIDMEVVHAEDVPESSHLTLDETNL